MADTEWHLDKRIPIALILMMVGQVAVIAWGAALMFASIETNRDSIAALDDRLRASEAATGSQAVQLGRIEQAVDGLRADTNRMLNILERGLAD